jgi:hypothetical protein
MLHAAPSVESDVTGTSNRHYSTPSMSWKPMRNRGRISTGKHVTRLNTKSDLTSILDYDDKGLMISLPLSHHFVDKQRTEVP